MPIQTDGPRLGDVTISEIQATNAAHDRQVTADAVLALVGVVLVIGLGILLPRLWRRARAPSGAASGTNG